MQTFHRVFHKPTQAHPPLCHELPGHLLWKSSVLVDLKVPHFLLREKWPIVEVEGADAAAVSSGLH